MSQNALKMYQQATNGKFPVHKDRERESVFYFEQWAYE